MGVKRFALEVRKTGRVNNFKLVFVIVFPSIWLLRLDGFVSDVFQTNSFLIGIKGDTQSRVRGIRIDPDSKFTFWGALQTCYKSITIEVTLIWSIVFQNLALPFIPCDSQQVKFVSQDNMQALFGVLILNLFSLGAHLKCLWNSPTFLLRN